MHRYLRKVLPFLYERNWYNGQYEFSHHRAALFGVLLVSVLLLLVYLWMEMQPVHYIR